MVSIKKWFGCAYWVVLWGRIGGGCGGGKDAWLGWYTLCWWYGILGGYTMFGGLFGYWFRESLLSFMLLLLLLYLFILEMLMVLRCDAAENIKGESSGYDFS